MSEMTLKERVERIENILAGRLGVDLDTIDADSQAVKDAFAESHPDHAEVTDASETDGQRPETLAAEQPEGSGKKDGPE